MRNLKLYPNNKKTLNIYILVVSGVIAFGYGSWAIDSGSIWHYLIALVGVYFFVKSTLGLMQKERADKTRVKASTHRTKKVKV